jgi:small subunit ribosomal protein S20
LPTVKKNPSAIKKARQAEKRHARNVAVKSALKTASKKVAATIASGTAETKADALKQAASLYSKAASKGIIHRNTASRKISRLAKAASKA